MYFDKGKGEREETINGLGTNRKSSKRWWWQSWRRRRERRSWREAVTHCLQPLSHKPLASFVLFWRYSATLARKWRVYILRNAFSFLFSYLTFNLAKLILQKISSLEMLPRNCRQPVHGIGCIESKVLVVLYLSIRQLPLLLTSGESYRWKYIFVQWPPVLNKKLTKTIILLNTQKYYYYSAINPEK